MPSGPNRMVSLVLKAQLAKTTLACWGTGSGHERSGCGIGASGAERDSDVAVPKELCGRYHHSCFKGIIYIYI